ncbi:hypothetical protein STEG23_009702 [Scotinomys teguina]
MAELLRSLQDSQLVARFQRRCGLFPAREDSPGEADPSKRATRVPEVAHPPGNTQDCRGQQRTRELRNSHSQEEPKKADDWREQALDGTEC